MYFYCLFPEEFDCQLINVKYFSSEHHDKYFHCDGTTKYAVLKECPYGHFYWAQRERCFPRRSDKSSNPGFAYSNAFSSGSSPDEQPQRMTQKVLRSGIRLGDLYDAQKDMILSGTSLWSSQELKKAKLNNRQIEQSTKLRYSTGKTSLDRLSLMDIKAELKLSFLGKFFKVNLSTLFYSPLNSWPIFNPAEFGEWAIRFSFWNFVNLSKFFLAQNLKNHTWSTYKGRKLFIRIFFMRIIHESIIKCRQDDVTK